MLLKVEECSKKIGSWLNACQKANYHKTIYVLPRIWYNYARRKFKKFKNFGEKVKKEKPNPNLKALFIKSNSVGLQAWSIERGTSSSNSGGI